MQSPSPRVLCTEDDRDTRELLNVILTSHGFEVISPTTSNEALELIKTQTFDLVLVDNWMPDLSGTELTKRIREFDTETPILFCSGAAYERDKEAARLAGAQGYLVKPVEVDYLLAEVSRIIAESKRDYILRAAMARSAA
ncbi:MAG: response regulator [Pyrinomonadaceae bacterium]